jgi:hypothetical protein
MKRSRVAGVALVCSLLPSAGVAQTLGSVSDVNRLEVQAVADWEQFPTTGNYIDSDDVNYRSLNANYSSVHGPWGYSPFGNGSVSSTGEGAAFTSSLTNTADGASYSVSTNVFTNLSSDATSTSLTYINSLSRASSEDDFQFTASQSTLVTFQGEVTFQNPDINNLLRLSLIDYTNSSGSVSILENPTTGAFTGSASLVAGDSYDISTAIVAYNSYYVSSFGVQNGSGSRGYNLSYTAQFTPAPEPLSIIGIALGAGGLLRRCRRPKA